MDIKGLRQQTLPSHAVWPPDRSHRRNSMLAVPWLEKLPRRKLTIAICPEFSLTVDRSLTLPLAYDGTFLCPATTNFSFALKLLSTIPPKTCSMDFIPTVLIKSCQTVFDDLIATLANLSFSEGTFPSIFKTAVVTPRLKKQVLIQILLKITGQFPILTISRRSLSVTSWPEFNSI